MDQWANLFCIQMLRLHCIARSRLSTFHIAQQFPAHPIGDRKHGPMSGHNVRGQVRHTAAMHPLRLGVLRAGLQPEALVLNVLLALEQVTCGQ